MLVAGLALIGAMEASAQASKAGTTFKPEPVAELMEQARKLEAEGKGADAVKLYVRAAQGGHGPAAYRLGQIYEKGIPGVARDAAESRKWFNAARVLGTPPAVISK